MTIEKLFETATRKKMRFSFRGQIGVEDLWDLSPHQLDSIFKELNSQLKQVSEESLLQVKTTADKELDVKIEIVKYIFGVKDQEAKARLQAKEIKEQEQKLLEILASKKEESLQNKSEAEIQAMLDELKKQKVTE